MHWSKRGQASERIAVHVLAQAKRISEPLPGRPLVLALRESSKRLDPDQERSWLKLPLDVLQRLGFIRDDSADSIKIAALWKQAKPSEGRCLIELWEDENHALKASSK